MKEQMLIYFLEDGYLQNPNIPPFAEKIPYGGIVCKVLNKYYGNPEIRSTNKRMVALESAMNKITATTGKYAALFDVWVSDLRLIVSDRGKYMEGLHKGGKRIGLTPKNVTINYYWDNEKQAIDQQAYIHDLEDLLVYDIGKVLDRNININQCYCGRYFMGRKGMKYCQEHRNEGTKNARKENLQKYRCRKLHKKINDRLLRSDSYHFGKYDPRSRQPKYYAEYEPLKYSYAHGEISEPEFYAALCELSEKYSVRQKK